MSVILSGKDNRTTLGALLLDCMLTEEITYESLVTLYPVEDGVEISDHITEGSKRVRISGVISTVDISGGFGFASLLGDFTQQTGTKLVDIVEAVEQMHKERILVDVYTAQLIYKDMAFTSLNISRSADQMGGNWASIKAELIRVRKVSLKTADVPAPETTAEPASGRAGETNKPAGKSNANSKAGSGKAGQGTYGPEQSPSDRTLTKKGVNGLLDAYKTYGGK